MFENIQKKLGLRCATPLPIETERERDLHRHSKKISIITIMIINDIVVVIIGSVRDEMLWFLLLL